jgi:E-phenylitaconyl-CoA hydratase
MTEKPQRNLASPLDLQLIDRVAVLTFNRPEAMNAMDPEMFAAFRDALKRIAIDDQILVAIITAEGDRSFSTGSDLKKTFPPQESFAELAFGRPGADTMDIFAGIETPKPLIAAVNGIAVAGGLEIALFCDIRICSSNARFGLAEVRIGSIPGAGGTQRLPRAVGLSDAMLILLTGDQFDAAEALRMGLVSKVVERSELMNTAMSIANRIKANAPLSVRAIKRVVYEGLDMPLQNALKVERYVWGTLRNTEDRIEGRKAFAEKRPPIYKGK